jgi:ribosomal-protein-alanine N-acetyltransferase
MTAAPPRRRLAAAMDVPAVVRLEAACFDDPWPAGDYEMLIGSGAIEVELLEAGGVPLAYAVFQLLPGETELLRLGVAPGARRRGLARRLLTSALDRLRAGGRPACHLEVRTDNEAARALYESLGFRPAGLRRGYYRDGADAVRYVREQAFRLG